MGLKIDAILIEGAQCSQRHNLKAARVRQHRPRPAHETAQAAELLYRLNARTQHQMIGVAKHDIRTARYHCLGQHSLDRAGGADGHEGRGQNGTVRGLQTAAAGRSVARRHDEPEPRHAAPRLKRQTSP